MNRPMPDRSLRSHSLRGHQGRAAFYGTHRRLAILMIAALFIAPLVGAFGYGAIGAALGVGIPVMLYYVIPALASVTDRRAMRDGQ